VDVKEQQKMAEGYDVVFIPEKYAEYVEKKARQRKDHLGEDYHECDFIMGAMCAYFFFGLNGQMPSAWIFHPLWGKPIVDYDVEDKNDNG
jgi:hypothetical protein